MRRPVISCALSGIVVVFGCGRPSPEPTPAPRPPDGVVGVPAETSSATGADPDTGGPGGEAPGLRRASDIGVMSPGRRMALEARAAGRLPPVTARDGRKFEWNPEQHPYLDFVHASRRLENVLGLQALVVRGESARADEFPWAAAVWEEWPGGLQVQVCGGTMIEKDWMLTAAHCEVSPNDQVTPGAHDLQSATTMIGIDLVCPHPAFDDETFDSDVALVRLGQPIDLPSYLPYDQTTPPVYPSGPATTFGWGVTEQGDFSHVLQKVEVPIVAQEECRAVRGADLPESFLCAGYKEGGKGICQGDSGGPLLVADASAPGWREVGIVSRGCAEPGLYDLYTRVAPFAPWIRAKLAGDRVGCVQKQPS